MPNVLHYWMIDPPRGGIQDDGKRSPAFEKQVTDPSGLVADAAVFCDANRQPEFIRVRLRDVPDEHHQEQFGPLLTLLKEHMISVLRMTWRHDVRLVPLALWTVEGANREGANITVQVPDNFEFDGATAGDVFIHTMPSRQSFRLLMDGVNDGVPLPYRFLSLFKFLEIRFKGSDDQWKWDALDRALAPFQEDYAALSLPRDFFPELCHLRDRCAHIRSGKGSRRILGVTQLNYEAAVAVEKMMPLLTDVCRIIYNTENQGKLHIADLRPWYERLLLSGSAFSESSS